KGASAETWVYTYDVANELVGVTKANTDGGIPTVRATYVYDALGDRIEKDVWISGSGTTVTRFAYDGSNVFADLSSGNALQTRRLYLHAVDSVFARISSSGTVAWYLPDRLGSVRDLINNSSSSIDRLDY